jgi:hypothetical protein
MTREQRLAGVREYISYYRLDTKSRRRENVYKRDYLYKYLDNVLKMTLTEIGKEFNRDHATIIYGIKTFNDLENDKLFKSATREVRNIFPLNDEVNEDFYLDALLEVNEDFYLGTLLEVKSLVTLEDFLNKKQ